jgi:glutamate racemase
LTKKNLNKSKHFDKIWVALNHPFFVPSNSIMSKQKGPIGVFDSGYGGLTILKALTDRLPQYDYLYLGDNARTPYGTRSFEVVYEFTKQAVYELFDRGCNLVILACNTASAKALRTIQMKDLVGEYASKRVLGVIRPSTEYLGELSRTKHVGILATPGTVKSGSYSLELAKFFPDLVITEHACPMWVPLIENDQHLSEGGKYFLEMDLNLLLEKDKEIDTIALACTHYPLVKEYLISLVPSHIQIIGQGDIVADRLDDYLLRHPEIESVCARNASIQFLTTENAEIFEEKASHFYGAEVKAEKIRLT